MGSAVVGVVILESSHRRSQGDLLWQYRNLGKAFYENPSLRQLHARLESDAQGSDQIRKQAVRLEGLLAQKAAERSRVVGLFRRGRLTETDLDAQIDEIGKEEAALEAQVARLQSRIAGADSIGTTVSSAEALLAKLRTRLDEPVSWEQKRRLIEVLVAGVRAETVEEGGVKQSKTTVTYRFSQPDQQMPLVLPQSYSTGSVIRIPTQPQTVGDHLRKRRLELKMLQREVAEQIGVDKTSVFNWEANGTSPEIRYMPAIIQFLGYNPLPTAEGWGGRLVFQRTSLGLSQKKAAERVGVDPSTLAKWERGEREPNGHMLIRAGRLLQDGESFRYATRRWAEVRVRAGGGHRIEEELPVPTGRATAGQHTGRRREKMRHLRVFP